MSRWAGLSLSGMKKFTRKLQRMGTHSYSIVVPKELVKEFSWRERQKLEIIADKRKTLRIRDWRSK